MRISMVTDNAIMFDNGNWISYDHEQDCCEYNWADFSALNENVINYDYDFNEDLDFEYDELGFKFGSNGHWIFIPCYSDQNGYYSYDIDIYYNGELVLSSVRCDGVEYDY